MSAKSANLAKSLHTVSVLANVASEYRKAMARAHDLTAAQFDDAAHWVDVALTILGYDGAADPYGLAARAVAILEKGAPSAAPRAARPASGAAILDAGRGFC